jgi:hypothetical protein
MLHEFTGMEIHSAVHVIARVYKLLIAGLPWQTHKTHSVCHYWSFLTHFHLSPNWPLSEYTWIVCLHKRKWRVSNETFDLTRKSEFSLKWTAIGQENNYSIKKDLYYKKYELEIGLRNSFNLEIFYVARRDVDSQLYAWIFHFTSHYSLKLNEMPEHILKVTTERKKRGSAQFQVSKL